MALNGFNSKALKAGDPEPAPPQPGTFRLYSMRFCPYAERAFLYAAKKNLPVEVVNINLVDKPEWYFKKHYQGKVPTLEHDGKLVIESAFIPLYLDDLFPESSILPKCPYGKIKQQILADRLGMVAAHLIPADTAVEFFTGYLKGEPKYDLGL